MSHKRFSLNNESNIRTSLRLLNVDSSKYSGDWDSFPHSHKYAELFYVLGGKGEFQIEQEFYPVSPKQLIIINPNVLHTEISYQDSPLEYAVLGIEGLELSEYTEGENRFKILDFNEGDDITTCLRNILQETTDSQPGNQTVCQAYMEILIVRLMRRINLSLNTTPLPSSSRQCAIVRRYIDAHYKENLTLEQLANISHLNKYYLVHSFKEEYGVSPINYQIDRRILESCVLLTQTDMSLSQISQVVGFSSPSYFSQMFRKSKGMSPTKYRTKTNTALS